ncbi:hypothetical protein ES332_D04G121500v1 [Gossypium tomentosum]|uniref:Uncharacterized protein n=1 Tax=Gossypium tomentosum TaxID=34277 RepID=A0A5D2LCC1_GOSTO|nr:hypothetical protein ES332_D04G121500v1 [Gossypium tomentosum]
MSILIYWFFHSLWSLFYPIFGGFITPTLLCQTVHCFISFLRFQTCLRFCHG